MGLTLLDASIVSAFLDRSDALHQVAADSVAAELDGRRSIALSAVTWAEVLSGVKRLRGPVFDAQRFLERGAIPIVPVDRAVAEAAADLRVREARRQRRLRTPDALVLGTAATHPEIDRVLTADAQWRRVRLPGVRIVTAG